MATALLPKGLDNGWTDGEEGKETLDGLQGLVLSNSADSDAAYRWGQVEGETSLSRVGDMVEVTG